MNAIAEVLTDEQKEKIARAAEIIDQKKTWFDSVVLSAHAGIRLKERFDCATPAAGLKFVRECLSRATFIGETVCEEKGQRGLAYGCNPGIYIIVSMDRKTVATAMKVAHFGKNMPEFMRLKYIEVARRELRVMHRKEKRWLKGMDLVRAEAHAKIWNNKLLILKTTSRRKIEVAKQEIESAERILLDKLQEIADIQEKIRQVARSYIAML